MVINTKHKLNTSNTHIINSNIVVRQITLYHVIFSDTD